MGWNTVKPLKEGEFFTPIRGEIRFYFLHSYHVACNNQEDVLSTTYYGYDFVSAFQKENIIGVQFHLNKASQFGINRSVRTTGFFGLAIAEVIKPGSTFRNN